MVQNREIEIEEQVACLQEQGFTKPLARYICQRVVEQFPLRIWIVDNSLSMSERDGRKLVNTSSPHDVRWKQCTRWEELTECVLYHAHMAALLQAPTQFHLLNPPSGDHLPQSCGVGEQGPDIVDTELRRVKRVLDNTKPSGATPLVRRLRQVYRTISSIAPSLQRYGQKVVVVVATDGKPTDMRGYNTHEVERQLESLLQDFQSLPCWMVIKLCTNDDSVVSYYQDLDEQLELNLEVLDDYLDESKEVHQLNPFLNYALVLHRCREMGCPNKLLDLLDERRLSLDEVKELVEFILVDKSEPASETSTMLPDPHVDWEDFRTEVAELNRTNASRPWHPMQRRVRPWIDMGELERTYHPSCYYTHLVGRRALIASCVLGALLLAVDWEDLWDRIVVEMTSIHGILSMMMGVVVLMVVLGRDPRVLLDKGVFMTFVAAGTMYWLWDKHTKFWQGLGSIVAGVLLLVGVILWNLRPRIY